MTPDRLPPVEQQITFLYTADLAATADFYENTLELALWRDQGACRIYHVAGGAYLGFCRGDAVPERPAEHVILTFVTPDVDGWYERLRARGAVFEDPPTVNPRFNIYHCFLRDPNGYRLEIQRFLD